MITGLLSKMGIGVLGLGTAVASGYGVYELSKTKSISEILGREHKVLKAEGEEDNKDWEKVVEEYKKAKDEQDPKKIKGFPSTGEIKKEDLKSKCLELLKKSFIKAEDQDYIDAKNWCTNSLIINKK